MNKNGKNIKCKKCQKEFYIPASRFSSKRYCSVDCSKADNYGFKPRNRDCVICGKSFLIETGTKMQKKTCSSNCHYELAKQITGRSVARRMSTKVVRTCKGCSAKFSGHGLYQTNYCTKDCQYKHYKEKRTGKGNPNYRGGIWAVGGIYHKGSKAAQIHSMACARKKKEFLKVHDYLFCEVCKISNTMVFDAHHIVFASEKPGHKHLHNSKNLIVVCRNCHLAFHRSKKSRNSLLAERGLVELFKDERLVK